MHCKENLAYGDAESGMLENSYDFPGNSIVFGIGETVFISTLFTVPDRNIDALTFNRKIHCHNLRNISLLRIYEFKSILLHTHTHIEVNGRNGVMRNGPG